MVSTVCWRPAVRLRDACKRDITSAQISIESWESAAADCNNWRQAVELIRGRQKKEETNSEVRVSEKRKAISYHARISNNLYMCHL